MHAHPPTPTPTRAGTHKSTGEAKPLNENGTSAARYGHTTENVCGNGFGNKAANRALSN